MHCGNCGTKSREGDKFCRSCGRRLLEENNSLEEQEDEYPSSAWVKDIKDIETPNTSSWVFFGFSLITFGAYPIYWSWRAWEILRRLQGEKYSASTRGFFYVLNSDWLFKAILKEAQRTGYKNKYPSLLLAILVFAGAIESKGSNTVKDATLYWLLYFSGIALISVCFSPVIDAYNHIIDHKGAQTKIGKLDTNWGLIVTIIAAFVLILVGNLTKS